MSQQFDMHKMDLLSSYFIGLIIYHLTRSIHISVDYYP